MGPYGTTAYGSTVPYSYQIPYSPLPEEDGLVKLVRDRKAHSELYYKFFHARLPILYNLYRGSLRFRFQNFRNNIHIPLMFATIQSDVAKKIETLFGTAPYVAFSGFGPDDASICRKWTSLAQAQLEDARALQKSYNFFVGADLYGKGIARVGWKYVAKDRMFRQQVRHPLTNRAITQIVKQKNVVEFDGPDYDILDLLDCYPQPGYSDLRGIGSSPMQWFIVRRYLDFSEVLALAYSGYYDLDEVLRMQQQGGGVVEAYDYFKAYRLNRFFMEAPERILEQEPMGRPVFIDEMYGFVPSEMTDDGYEDRYISVANGRYLIQNIPNPNWHCGIPLVDYAPSPDPHYFFPMGKGETIAKMQIVANRFTNQQLDALDLFSDPAFFINEAMGLDMDKLFIRPGKMVETQGPPEGNIMPISPDLRGIEMGTAKTQELWQWAQMATGIAEDTGMGIAQPGSRETARSVLVRSEAGASRMLLEARLAEVDYVEPLADMFIALDKQHLDLPRQITILGRSAQRDPITGGEIIGRHTLGFSDMQANFDARSRGSITKVSKGVKQQNMVMLLQAAAANPVVAGAVNWLNFFRDTFEIFDVENVNELIETDDAFQRNKAIVNGEPGMAPPDNGSMQEPNNGFPLGQTPGMAPGARVPGAPYGVNSGNMPAMMGRGAA